MRRIKRLAFIGLLVAGTIGWLYLHFGAPGILLVPHRHMAISLNSDVNIESVTIDVAANIKLAGNLHGCSGDKKGTVIVLHGVGSCKEHSADIASWLNSENFDALAIDLRAHGKSGGKYCTYGFYEKDDVSKVVDWLSEKGEQNIHIYGSSLGGAIALQAMSVDERIKSGVIISTFASLEEVSLDYQKRLTGLDWQWLNSYVTWRAEEIGDMNLDSVNVQQCCERIFQPVYLIHGTEDIHVNPEYAIRNFGALSSEAKHLNLVPNADHNTAWFLGGKVLHHAVAEFLSQHSRNGPSYGMNLLRSSGVGMRQASDSPNHL